jgi:hypothetical protein
MIYGRLITQNMCFVTFTAMKYGDLGRFHQQEKLFDSIMIYCGLPGVKCTVLVILIIT